jgi:hypothetical protein
MHEIFESELLIDVCGIEVLNTKPVDKDMLDVKNGELIIG